MVCCLVVGCLWGISGGFVWAGFGEWFWVVIVWAVFGRRLYMAVFGERFCMGGFE